MMIIVKYFLKSELSADLHISEKLLDLWDNNPNFLSVFIIMLLWYVYIITMVLQFNTGDLKKNIFFLVCAWLTPIYTLRSDLFNS